MIAKIGNRVLSRLLPIRPHLRSRTKYRKGNDSSAVRLRAGGEPLRRATLSCLRIIITEMEMLPKCEQKGGR